MVIGMKEEVLAGIVQKLEDGRAFKEIVYDILSDTAAYLQISNGAVMQIQQDNRTIGTIVDYVAEDELVLAAGKMPREQYLLGTDSMKYLTADACTPEEKAVLDMLKVKTSITVPIYIDGVCAMYFALYDANRCLAFDEDELKFISDVAAVVQTIAQRKMANSSLLSSYEVLRDILGSISTGIMVFGTGGDSIVFENEAAQNSDEIQRTMHECLEEQLRKNGADSVEIRPMERYDAESGLWFEVKFSNLRWIDGSDVIVCTAMDITQKKKNQQKVEYQASNDFLTGLYNRMKCESDLRSVIQALADKNSKGAVLFIDLDDFKHINDGLGHQYGDILLQQIAAGLQSIPALRGNCYRVGGDEFIVLVKPDIYADLQRIIKNVLAMFNKPWHLMGTEYYCTMSMGIAVFPDNSKDVYELIKMADIAMYEAKKSGKNRSSFYDGNNSTNAVRQLDIESNMRQAIASEIKEFVVFYQPVVDTFTQECRSCEALVRWNSKALGFMGPVDFIPLAEYLGLITEIGDYVLEEACTQCRKWNENGWPDFHVNINLSVVQLLQKNVVDNIGRIFNKTGVNPNNIILEITESFAINDMDRVLHIIEGLKRLGPKIALDDFGTGYSSLNYIKQLPLNIIKVDKTFIDDIVEDEYAQAFVKLIVDLSKTIGTQIVVEGVEYAEQYELLKRIGVNFIQGYFFGKPVCAEDFERMHLGRENG